MSEVNVWPRSALTRVPVQVRPVEGRRKECGVLAAVGEAQETGTFGDLRKRVEQSGCNDRRRSITAEPQATGPALTGRRIAVHAADKTPTGARGNDDWYDLRSSAGAGIPI